jgi:hypothetical protein
LGVAYKYVLWSKVGPMDSLTNVRI